MATWNIHWQCCFQSLNGTQYAVNIYEQSYTGSIIQLTGSADPFVTQEDDSDDIFTPIRMQTGYFRFIDPDGTLFEDIIPANNTEKLVRLVTGTYNNGTFIQGSGSDSVKWQGFVQAQAYTQPWDGNAHVVELPVKSLLGALEDIQIPESMALQEKNVAALIVNGLTGLLDGPFADVEIITDSYSTDWLSLYLQWQAFFRKETVSDQGDSFDQFVGMTYYEAISAVLTLFGLMAREDGNTLCLARYDQPAGTQCRITSLDWENFGNIANETFVQSEETKLPMSTDLLSAVEWRGIDNTTGFLPGGRNAKVVLTFSPLNEELLALPMTTEDASQVYTIDKVVNGTVRVQPHERQSSTHETFTYRHYANSTGQSTNTNYTACFNRSVIMTPIMPPVTDDPSYVTGAFPVRFSFNKTDESSQKFLSNGMMVNIRRLIDYGASLPSNAEPVYSIKSQMSPRQRDYAKGYLNIDMEISCFMETNAGYDRKTLQFGTMGFAWERRYKMFLKLQWGTMFWNGEEWTTDSSSTFSIETDGARIITNLADGIFSDKTDGFFIPVTSSMSGQVTLTIMNYAAYKIIYPNDQTEVFAVNSSIISRLSVLYLAPIGMTASDRTENTYRQTIMQSGFSEDKEISLLVGTMNNNVESLSFVKDSPTSYTESMTYWTGDHTVKYQRPEIHLLDRMVGYYSIIRRTLHAVIGHSLDLLLTRYNDHVRNYFGIHQQVSWRDDTEIVKFIEVL